MSQIAHPRSGKVIEGERLGPGSSIQEGDCYDCTDGTWAQGNQCVGLKIRTFNNTIWVRPAVETANDNVSAH